MNETLRRRQSPDSLLVASAGAGLAILGVTAVMVPLREHVDNSVIALLFVLPIMAAALVGGRLASLASAIIAAMTFDFFFTRPFESLKIDNGDDLVTALLLAVVALCAAELGLRMRRTKELATSRHSEIARLLRVGELAVSRDGPQDVASAVRAELIAMFALRDCTFVELESVPQDSARLGRHGALEGAGLRVTSDGFALPSQGLAIPVNGRGRYFGYLWLTPQANSHASAEQRFVAVALAGELALAFAASAPELP